MTVIDDYLSKLPKDQASQLQKIRQIVLDSAPEAEEVITYGMPGFKYKGKYLISFGAFKDHLSIFPGPEAISKNMNLLKNFKISKGTVQFTNENLIPPSVIKKIIEFRVNEISKTKSF